MKKIKSVGKKKVYDISVKDAEHYFLENGVVTHNTGIYYSADTIWVVGRQQERPDDEVIGYNFIINVEKSRYVREKSKIPISVTFDGGINKWSGLFDICLSGGYIAKPSNGWFQKVDQETGEMIGKKYRKKEIVDNKDFWEDIIETTDLVERISQHFTVGNKPIFNEEELEIVESPVEELEFNSSSI